MFNWRFYVQFYKDLQWIKTEKTAFEHWNNIGKIENRIIGIL